MSWQEQFIEYIRTVKRYSGRTVALYDEVLSDFAAFCNAADDLIPFLERQTLRSYEVHLLDGRSFSPKTVNLHLSALSSFCSYLVRQNLLASNPLSTIKRPKVARRLPEFYSKEAMTSYLQSTAMYCDPVLVGSYLQSPSDSDSYRDFYEHSLRRLIISILYNTGIRRSELISLRYSDFDSSRGALSVRGKGDKMREIPLSKQLCDEISLYLEQVEHLSGDSSCKAERLLVCSSLKPLYPVKVDRVVKEELSDRKGISGRKSPHVLRHTLATELLEEGTQLGYIKELLGHSSLAATQVYTHTSAARLKTVYEKAHPRAQISTSKSSEKMEIKIQTVKFNADQKLIDFVEKKFSKIEKFYDRISSVDVTLSLLADNANKNVRLMVGVPGSSEIVERNAKTFEQAINECADIMKEKLTRLKEKQNA